MAAYWRIAAHSAYDMFSWYKYLSVMLVIPTHLSLWNFFLIAPFSDHCLLVHFFVIKPSLKVTSQVMFQEKEGTPH